MTVHYPVLSEAIPLLEPQITVGEATLAEIKRFDFKAVQGELNGIRAYMNRLGRPTPR